jgi:hypothetical protein
MKCAVSEIIFNLFSYLLICTYMVYIDAWSCVNHVIMKKKKKIWCLDMEWTSIVGS